MKHWTATILAIVWIGSIACGGNKEGTNGSDQPCTHPVATVKQTSPSVVQGAVILALGESTLAVKIDEVRNDQRYWLKVSVSADETYTIMFNANGDATDTVIEGCGKSVEQLKAEVKKATDQLTSLNQAS